MCLRLLDIGKLSRRGPAFVTFAVSREDCIKVIHENRHWGRDGGCDQEDISPVPLEVSVTRKPGEDEIMFSKCILKYPNAERLL